MRAPLSVFFRVIDELRLPLVAGECGFDGGSEFG
jgi:hypothetical protein